MPEDEKPTKPGRRNQPRCGTGTEGEGCGHPASFHGSGTHECRALGCSCTQWVEPVEVPA